MPAIFDVLHYVRPALRPAFTRPNFLSQIFSSVACKEVDEL